jgi:TRAP-type C4-dicarboxylate transport system substrate-binding protein
MAPAFIVLSSQWFGLARHFLDMKWAAMTGAMVISNEAWEKIPEKYHPLLKSSAQEISKKIKNELRYQSDEAIEVMKKYGLIVHEIDKETLQDWQISTEEFYPNFKGVLVPADMYEKVMNLLPELKSFRESRTK